MLMLLALVLLSLLASPASAVSAVELAFSADILPAAAPLAGTVFDSFGSSHGSTTLRSTWRSHFASTQHDIAFQRVRFHGILDDDMSTYLDGQANGALVFDTLDYLVAQHITPTVEIGFMPEQLAADPQLTTFHYKGAVSRRRRTGSGGVRSSTQFTRLLVDRYSAAVVRQWPFEVWNEPNCGFYYQAGCCGAGCGNQTAYLELYAQHAAGHQSSGRAAAGGRACHSRARLDCRLSRRYKNSRRAGRLRIVTPLPDRRLASVLSSLTNRRATDA